MTIDYKNDFEGGSNGTALNATNTALGTGNHALDGFSTGGTGSIVFSNSSPIEGSLSALITAGTSLTYISWNISGSPTRVIARMKFKLPSLPAAFSNLLSIYASSTSRADIRVNTDGTVELNRNGAGLPLSISTHAVAVNTVYAIELYVLTDAGSAGEVGYRLLDASETVLDQYVIGGNSGLTGPITQIRYAVAKVGGIASVVADGIHAKDLSSGWIGPDVVAPTSNAGSDQSAIEPFSTVTLDGTGSTSNDGGTITYAWTQTGGTTVALSSSTSATPSFTAPPTLAGDTLTFSLTVTESGVSDVTPDTVSITVLPHPTWMITNPVGPVLKATKRQRL